CGYCAARAEYPSAVSIPSFSMLSIACPRGPPATGYRLVEQRQVDGVAHRAITEIARVKPVAAIVDRQHLGRTLGVAQRLVEIDDAIEGAAGADPLVDRDTMPLAHRVPRTGQERLVAERRQGGAQQFDPTCLCPHGHLGE